MDSFLLYSRHFLVIGRASLRLSLKCVHNLIMVVWAGKIWRCCNSHALSPDSAFRPCAVS